MGMPNVTLLHRQDDIQDSLLIGFGMVSARTGSALRDSDWFQPSFGTSLS